MNSYRFCQRLVTIAVSITFAVGAVAGVSACSSGDGSDEMSTDETPTTAGEIPIPDETTPSSSDPLEFDDTGAQLEGSWTADASETLADNLANLGGASPGLTCGGPINMTFSAGVVTRTGEIVCSAGEISGAGTFTSTGVYVADGSTLTISEATTEGSITIAGQSVPFADARRDGASTFAVAGDVLSIPFSDPGVGTIANTYTRAG